MGEAAQIRTRTCPTYTLNDIPAGICAYIYIVTYAMVISRVAGKIKISPQSRQKLNVALQNWNLFLSSNSMLAKLGLQAMRSGMAQS